MQVVIFGATGMVGYEVLLSCIKRPEISKIITVGRSKTDRVNDKVVEIIHNDFTNFTNIQYILKQSAICFYCLGVYQNAVSKEVFWHVTVDYTQSLIKSIEKTNKHMVFCLFSAQGAKQNESSMFLFARAKGKVEKILLESTIEKKFIFRPGYINPGIHSNRFSVFEYILKPLFKLFPFIGIDDSTLARVMTDVGLYGNNKTILENRDIRKLSDSI